MTGNECMTGNERKEDTSQFLATRLSHSGLRLVRITMILHSNYHDLLTFPCYLRENECDR